MSSIAEEVAALRGTKPASFKDSRPYRRSRLLAAMTVSSLGDWVGFVAVTCLVTRGARPPPAVAVVMTARMLPAVLFGPFAGAIVDRWTASRS